MLSRCRPETADSPASAAAHERGRRRRPGRWRARRRSAPATLLAALPPMPPDRVSPLSMVMRKRASRAPWASRNARAAMAAELRAGSRGIRAASRPVTAVDHVRPVVQLDGDRVADPVHGQARARRSPGPTLPMVPGANTVALARPPRPPPGGDGDDVVQHAGRGDLRPRAGAGDHQRVRAVAARVHHDLVVGALQAAERRGLGHRLHAHADPVVRDARDVAQHLLAAPRARRGARPWARPWRRGRRGSAAGRRRSAPAGTAAPARCPSSPRGVRACGRG